ncbi:MAG: serine O-acetyltransferase EpsC [Candidatus Sericytochromatia bacterium]
MKEIVEELKNLQELNALNKQLPINKKTISFFEELIQFLFPIRSDKINCDITSCNAITYLNNSLIELLGLIENNELKKENHEKLSNYFLKSLPEIYQKLLTDAKLILDNDPAAKSLEEIILTYPGFFAIATYRICNLLAKLKIPILPRLISEYAHSKTGIDIHPSAEIETPFFIDHGTGIVIGETTNIGKNVKIYQGVTLGALIVKKELNNKKRHPTIEDNVVIYSNATILGGETVIGKNSIIGGNVWLTKSLEPNSIVYYKSDLIIKNSNNEDLLFYI